MDNFSSPFLFFTVMLTIPSLTGDEPTTALNLTIPSLTGDEPTSAFKRVLSLFTYVSVPDRR